MKKVNLIKGLLCLLAVGFILISCNQSNVVDRTKSLFSSDQPDVVAEVINSEIRIIENNTSHSNKEIMVEIKAGMKDSNIQNGIINIRFENDDIVKIQNRHYVSDTFEPSPYHEHDYKFVRKLIWSHEHVVGNQKKDCDATITEKTCYGCGKTLIIETHNY